MNFHITRRLFLPAAVLGGVAVFAAVFFVALAVRSVVADPAGPIPNPGHAWTEVQAHGVDADAVFVSTENDQAFEVRVNGDRALRLEPDATSPNVIGGYSGNSVTGGVYGAAIGGGGTSDSINQVTANYATVGGGLQNTASGAEATVGGGLQNTASGDGATVGGGIVNHASALFATVGGGGHNTTSGERATVGGGWLSTASGGFATVPGGRENAAAGDYSFAAGRQAKADHQGAFVWADSTAADFASTANDQFLVRASGGVGIGTTTPQATLDVNGYAKLAVNASAPVACDSAHDGSIALTSNYWLCVCNPNSWVRAADGVTPCVW